MARAMNGTPATTGRGDVGIERLRRDGGRRYEGTEAVILSRRTAPVQANRKAPLDAAQGGGRSSGASLRGDTPQAQNQWPSETVMPAINCQSGDACAMPAASATSSTSARLTL
jgi:hypothetical protein